jgi:hypothetical protein
VDDRALNILTIVVLVPLFVVASVGALFLQLAVATRKGVAASFLCASAAVGIPIFAFTWRTGTPFPTAMLLAAVGGPSIVLSALAVLALEIWMGDLAHRASERISALWKRASKQD